MSAVLGVTLLASDCTGECQKAGPWGFAIILVLCVACYFLFRSMSKHLRKVPTSFGGTDASTQARSSASTTAPALLVKKPATDTSIVDPQPDGPVSPTADGTELT